MVHNKTLTELKWFKWALWGPIVTAVLITLVITICDYYHHALDWGLSSTQINDAISRLKLPIAIASLAFPLVALVASNHRSVQTAAQITVTESKNAFENNIRHRELFKGLLEKEEMRWGVVFRDSDKLYENIFSKNDFSRFAYYADDMTRDVPYYSCVDDEGKVSKHSCFIFPVLDEIMLYLRWFQTKQYHPTDTYKSLEIMFKVLDEFDLLIGANDSERLAWKVGGDDKNLETWHPNVIHSYIKKVFDFLENSFVEVIRFSYSSSFRKDEQYINCFFEFLHELEEAKTAFKYIVDQYNQE